MEAWQARLLAGLGAMVLVLGPGVTQAVQATGSLSADEAGAADAPSRSQPGLRTLLENAPDARPPAPAGLDALDAAQDLDPSASPGALVEDLLPLLDTRRRLVGAPAGAGATQPNLGALSTVTADEPALAPQAGWEHGGVPGPVASQHAAPGPAGASAVAPVPDHPTLPDAVHTLMDRYDASLDEGDEERIAALGQLPEHVETWLTDVVDAYLFIERVTQGPVSLAPTDPDGLGDPERSRLAGALSHAARHALPPPAVQYCDGGEEQFLGVLFLDLSCQDSVYRDDVRLSIDMGGDDDYHNNAGGGSALSAMAVDLEGADRYTGQDTSARAVAGGAWHASGLLMDLEGEDRYTASAAGQAGVNGGAFHGAGFLYDGGGRDRFLASVGSGAVNGATDGGVAALVAEGHQKDTYRGTVSGDGAANGGANTGSAFLYDEGGDDTYRADVQGLGGGNGGSTAGHALLLDEKGNDTYGGTLAEGGLNGGSRTGVAALGDRGGNDTYDGTVDVGGINGGSFQGQGTLVDKAGNDTYEGTVVDEGGVNAGVLQGVGILRDLAGNDTYDGRVGASGGVNAGSWYGASFLRDDAGNDTYRGAVAGTGGLNGGTLSGFAYLSDEGGNNTFAGDGPEVGGWNGGAEGFGVTEVGALDLALPGGVAVLQAGPGNDTYLSNGTTQGAGAGYGLGVLLDAGGNNTYVAGPEGIAQGAGRGLGMGFVVDHGSRSVFTLDDEAHGQGVGQQGVGLLAHVNPRATSRYQQADPVASTLSEGGGTGLLVDTGTVETPLPTPTCRTPTLQTVGSLEVCLPDEENTSRPLRNPVTDEPVGDIPQPPIPCSSIGVGPIQCDAIVAAVLGEEAVEFLEMDHHEARVSGSLDLFVVDQGSPDSPSLHGRMVMPSYDHSCHASCHTLKKLAHAT